MRGRVLLAFSALALVGAVVLAWQAAFPGGGPEPVAAAAPSPVETSDRVLLSDRERRDLKRSAGFARDVDSLLKVDRKLGHGEFVWREAGVPRGPLWIRVDRSAQMISVFRAGHEIGTAVVLFGAEEKATPTGDFPILSKAKDYHSRTYDAPMPFTLRLTADGVAIHGSDVRWGRATHGCVGVPLEFARKLFEQASKGDVVTIV